MKICNKCKKYDKNNYQISNNLYECVDSIQCNIDVHQKNIEIKNKLLIRKTYYKTRILVITSIDSSNPYHTEDYITELYKIRINCIKKECYENKDGVCRCAQDNFNYPETLFNGKDYADEEDPILENSVYNEEIKKFRKFFKKGCENCIIKIVLDENITQESSLYDKYIDIDFNSDPPLDN